MLHLKIRIKYSGSITWPDIYVLKESSLSYGNLYRPGKSGCAAINALLTYWYLFDSQHLNLQNKKLSTDLVIIFSILGKYLIEYFELHIES